MKTKGQKQEQLAKGEKLISESSALIFADFTGVPNEQLRMLRRQLKDVGARLFIIKKRLLNLILKNRKSDSNLTAMKVPVGTVFATGSIETVSSPVYKFFKELKLEKEKILGGFEVASARFIESEKIRFYGQLPPREVLVGQLLGLLSSPIRSFLYILDQKSKRS